MRLAILLTISLLLCTTHGSGQTASKTVTKPTDHFKPLQNLIGGWRGVGQPKRGSNRGAWSEKAEWAYDFSGKQPQLSYKVEKGKLLDSATLGYDTDQQEFVLTTTSPDDEQREYRGKLTKNELVMTAEPKDDLTHRVTITLLNDKRTLVLFQQQRSGSRIWDRIAEVGYTRQGVRLARVGGNKPVCIVTGGTGTTPVTHNGKTYYVCCSGCKQAFEDDPETFIELAKSE